MPRRESSTFDCPLLAGRVGGPSWLAFALEDLFEALVALWDFLARVGVQNLVPYVRRFGITSKIEPVLPIALGAVAALVVAASRGPIDHARSSVEGPSDVFVADEHAF